MHFPALPIPYIKPICREYAVVIQIKFPTVLNMIFISFCAIINLTDQLHFYLMMDIIFSNEAPLLLTDIFQNNIVTMLHQSVSEKDGTRGRCKPSVSMYCLHLYKGPAV